MIRHHCQEGVTGAVMLTGRVELTGINAVINADVLRLGSLMKGLCPAPVDPSKRHTWLLIALQTC